MENATKFAESMVLEGKSKNTVKEYNRRLSQWYNFLRNRGIIQVLKAQPSDVVAYKDSLLEQKQSPRTINVKISSVSIFYDWAIERGHVEKNPVKKGLYIKAPAAITKRLSDDDLRIFELWINNLQENIRAAFWCIYGTGARVGEIAKLTKSDIKVVKGAIYINIRDAKWHSDRQIPIVNPMAARIVYLFSLSQETSSQPLFRLSKRTIQLYASQFSVKTGINFHCHTLRHTFATRLVEKGVPIHQVQHLLGHKNPAMTMHYTTQANSDLNTLAPKITLNYTMRKGKLI